MKLNSSFRTDRVVNISDAVTSRKIFLNQEGLDMIADLRRFFEDGYYNKTGEIIQLSLPALVHTVMTEYTKLMEHKGYNIRQEVEEDEDDQD